MKVVYLDKVEPPLDLFLDLVKGQIALGMGSDTAVNATWPVPDRSSHAFGYFLGFIYFAVLYLLGKNPLCMSK